VASIDEKHKLAIKALMDALLFAPVFDCPALSPINGNFQYGLLPQPMIYAFA
jgi:hypothetical protein